jgi:hypothetical protein
MEVHEVSARRGTLMATRLAVALAVMMLAGCAGSQFTVPPDPIPSLAAPFEAHLSEYLDPEWLSQPSEGNTGCLEDLDVYYNWPKACGLEGSIKGSVVIVDADTRQIAPGFLSALASPDSVDALGHVKGDGGTPISLAATPAEVDTVVLLWSTTTQAATYTDGARGYRTDYRVKIVDFAKQAVVGEAYIKGQSPPYPVKSSKGDWTGSAPWDVLLIALSCAADPSCSPKPTPTPTPTPKPTPLPEEALVAACDGEPVSWAAPYAGKVHPLVVVDTEGFSASYAINNNWRDNKWTSPVQLVVCVPDGTEASVKVGSCGRWKRQGDGVWGELVQYRYKSTIRMVIAETGKTLQRKALYGSVPPCGNAPQDQYSIPDMNEKPPWHLYGVEVTPAQVNKYATAVSTQKVQ